MCVLECLSRLKISTRVKDIFLFKSCSFVNACVNLLFISVQQGKHVIDKRDISLPYQWFCISLLHRGLFVLWGSWGERKRESAGRDGKGKERREASSYRPPRAFYFFDYCHIFIRIPSGSVCGGERFCIVLINNCCLNLSHENIGKRDCCLSPIAVPWVWRKSFPLN